MKPNNISLSLIVPTIGRDQYLFRLLDSLCAQSRKDFEVIVVDQSDRPNSVRSILNNYSGRLSIQHIIQNERNAVKARNEGVLHAVGDLLAWPDDDCFYENMVVENAIELFHTIDISVLIGCPLAEDGSPYNRRVPKTGKWITITDALFFGIEWAVFMKKDIFQKAGGYDPRFGPGKDTTWYLGESSDLCMRVLNFDAKIYYSPLIRIHHPQPRSMAADAPLKAYRSAYGMGAVCRKNNVSGTDLLHYFWSYLRAFGWAVIRFNLKDTRYHYLRISGLVQGYRNYYKDAGGA